MGRSFLISVVAIQLFTASLGADEIRMHFTDESAPKEVAPQAPDKRYGRYCVPDHVRAGWPRCISSLARPSICRDYSLGYVGGGVPWLGESRTCQEGTLGMDYTGWFFHRRTWLNWTHGRRYQGGAGKYQTDGPKLHE